MRPRIPVSFSCLLLLVVTGLSPNHRIRATPAHYQSSQIASSHFMTEVRLRKLHLARPDLIPYPIEIEVYC
jgi:hypothetical protein